MTTGSWERCGTPTYSALVANRRYGCYQNSKTWSGTDRPRLESPKIKYYYYKRYGSAKKGYTNVLKVVKIRQPGFDYLNRNPKRVRNEDHPFTMTSLLVNVGIFKFYYGCQGPNPPASYTLSNDFAASTNCPEAIAKWDTSMSLLEANWEYQLIDQLKEQIAGSDFNMSVFLGEGHQALQMIGDSALRVARSLRWLKKGNVLLAARSLLDGTVRNPKRIHDWRKSPTVKASSSSLSKKTSDAMSADWLQLQYGWLPLLSDARAGAELLAHTLNAPMVKSYKAQTKRRYVRTISKTYTNCGVTTGSSGTTERFTKKSIIARISEPPTVPQLLGLKDPELVVWELLPWSFVIDWFIPIGDWMAARAFTQKLRGTFVTSTLNKGSRKDYPINGTLVTGNSKLDNYCCRAQFDRVISTSLDVPLPTFKSLSKAASWQHCTNALALLVQQRSSSKRNSP